jgi:hypothetical protein
VLVPLWFAYLAALRVFGWLALPCTVPKPCVQQDPPRQPGRAVDITARIERSHVLGGLISEYRRAA